MNAALLLMMMAGPVFLSDEPRPAAIQVDSQPGGDLVRGPKGTPLYSFDGLERGERCTTGPCAERWPLVDAAADAKPVGAWTLKSGFEGHDKVWFYRNLPVYSFAGDVSGGKASGDGIAGDWHALRYIGPAPKILVPPGVKPARLGAGYILADYRGRTLYTFARDGAKPACKDECLDVWPPLVAPALAAAVGDWAVVERPDGLRQWAYGGRLVYRFSEDLTPGATNGAGLGGVWNTIPVGTDPKPVSGRDQNGKQGGQGA